MARGVNKAILVGTLGNDPDTRYTATGAAVANISIATNESWKDKGTGELQERTEWHRIVFFNRLAEVVGEYLRKGSQVYVEGRIQTRKWTDKEGIERYSTEIVANEMQMLGGKSSGGARKSESTSPPPANNHEPSSPAAQTQTAASDDFDDDIPF